MACHCVFLIMVEVLRIMDIQINIRYAPERFWTCGSQNLMLPTFDVHFQIVNWSANEAQ